MLKLLILYRCRICRYWRSLTQPEIRSLCWPKLNLFLIFNTCPVTQMPNTIKGYSHQNCFVIIPHWVGVSSIVESISPQPSLCSVRKVLADFAVCDVLCYCKALWDVTFRQIEGNGRKFRHIELSNSVKFSNSARVNVACCLIFLFRAT